MRTKCAAIQSDFGPHFTPFFRWLFEMGKAIAALNNEVHAGNVRTVPLSVRARRPPGQWMPHSPTCLLHPR